MLHISKGRDLVTVVVTVDAPADVLVDLAHHARLGLDLFRRYPGYLSGALHLSEDGELLIGTGLGAWQRSRPSPSLPASGIC